MMRSPIRPTETPMAKPGTTASSSLGMCAPALIRVGSEKSTPPMNPPNSASPPSHTFPIASTEAKKPLVPKNTSGWLMT